MNDGKAGNSGGLFRDDENVETNLLQMQRPGMLVDVPESVLISSLPGRAKTDYGDRPSNVTEAPTLSDGQEEDDDENEEKDTKDTVSNGKGIRRSPRVVLDDTNEFNSLENAPFNVSRGVHIITTFFMGNYHKKRKNEFLECLRRNLENPYVEAMHILWEDVNPRTLLPRNITHKLVTSKIEKQPTYFRLFSYVNQILKRGSIAIVTNADIYFDQSLKQLKFGPLTKDPSKSVRTAYALSRRHSDECGSKNDWKSTYDLCLHYIGSHDAFVFAPPTPRRVLANSYHTQNNFGAENIIVWGFLWAGNYRVFNPCQRIHAFHYRKLFVYMYFELQ